MMADDNGLQCIVMALRRYISGWSVLSLAFILTPLLVSDALEQRRSVQDPPHLSAHRMSPTASTRAELVFVDSRVENLHQLLTALITPQDGDHHIGVHVLDGQRDGVVQISEVLSSYRTVDAVHILSHGTEGSVQLGNMRLRAETLPVYANVIKGWRTALTDRADLLFYACNLAGGAPGRRLLNAISTLTGTDVAASVNRTGHADLGGDWVLEFASGHIDASVVLRPQARQEWRSLYYTDVSPAGHHRNAGHRWLCPTGRTGKYNRSARPLRRHPQNRDHR